jgi:hypothetical protein
MQTNLTQREIADRLIAETFAELRRVPIAEIVAAGLERGISRRTLTRAAQAAQINTIHNGPHGAFWESTERS